MPVGPFVARRLARLFALLGAALTALAAPARTPAAPGAEATFESLQAAAEPVESLDTFLSRYVGRCTDVFEKRTCEQNVAAVRKAAGAKTFALRVQEAAPLVKPRFEGQKFVLLLTPFVDGNGLALTRGVPRADGAGRPVVDLLPIPGKLPEGVLEMEFERPFRVGAIELELVFQPEKAWRLPRREGGAYEGVAARLLAVRVVDAQTGAAIASRVLR